MITRTLRGVVVALFVAGHLSAQTPAKQDIEAAKQEYEQAVPPGNEKARLTYVSKLAQIADRFVSEYRQSGQRKDEAMRAINSELQKHPAPRDIDSKKLTQLLVGKWESPRHTYVFRANGNWGNEDGPVASNWRIQGNQLIEDDAGGTIILLNRDYFIYARGTRCFFTRVQKSNRIESYAVTTRQRSRWKRRSNRFSTATAVLENVPGENGDCPPSDGERDPSK